MAESRATDERIEVLRAVVDRLGSPDLTLGEAKGLRCRLLYLTEPNAADRFPAATPMIPCETHRQDSPSPECRNCAA